MARLKLLTLLLALLPGLAVAGVADMRLCLYALVGADSCCMSLEVVQESCCSEREAPGGQQVEPPLPECELCCVEVHSGTVTAPSAGQELELPALIQQAAELPGWSAPASRTRVLPKPEAPPPRWGVAAKLQLRI